MISLSIGLCLQRDRDEMTYILFLTPNCSYLLSVLTKLIPILLFKIVTFNYLLYIVLIVYTNVILLYE